MALWHLPCRFAWLAVLAASPPCPFWAVASSSCLDAATPEQIGHETSVGSGQSAAPTDEMACVREQKAGSKGIALMQIQRGNDLRNSQVKNSLHFTERREVSVGAHVQDPKRRSSSTTCRTASQGEACYDAVSWAMQYGVTQNPERYGGLTQNSSFKEFQAFFFRAGLNNHVCKELPCTTCHTSVKGEPCYAATVLAMESLASKTAEIPGLAANSTFEDVQAYLNQRGTDGCLKPCLPCQTAQEGSPCYTAVLWAMMYGITMHPEWYPGLAASSSFSDFQQFLHDSEVSQKDCPKAPCGDTVVQLAAAPVPTPSAPAPAERSPTPPSSSSSQSRFAVKEQTGAQIPAGGKISLFMLGSSNILWQWWPDKLHLFLSNMGYQVETNSRIHLSGMATQPLKAPKCDDDAELQTFPTLRVGQIGWCSWGFAYESRDDCNSDGFRSIAGYSVSCINAWGCNPDEGTAQMLEKPSDLAQAAQNSDVVIISGWVNDSRQKWTFFKCFNGQEVTPLQSTKITLSNLQRLIAAIHAVKPSVLIFVIALYPESQGVTVLPDSLGYVSDVNAAMRKGLEQLPNTYLVNYSLPLDAEVFQSLSPGHANCRGDAVIATSILEALYERKVIARSLALGSPEECPDGMSASACAQLSPVCCQRSALCSVAPDSTCRPYGPGAQ